MSAKSVWGVVLIVLGVVGVIAGINQIAEISQLDKAMGDITRQFGGQQYWGPYVNAARDAKIGGMIKIVGGACLSIFGTWLIQQARHEERREQRKQFAQEEGDWRLGGENPDNDRWRF